MSGDLLLMMGGGRRILNWRSFRVVIGKIHFGGSSSVLNTPEPRRAPRRRSISCCRAPGFADTATRHF